MSSLERIAIKSAKKCVPDVREAGGVSSEHNFYLCPELQWNVYIIHKK